MTNKVVTFFAGVGVGALVTALVSNVNKEKKCKNDSQTGGKVEEEEEEIIIVDKKYKKGNIVEEIILSDKKNKYEEDSLDTEDEEESLDTKEEKEEKEKKEKKHYDKLCSELENKEEKNVCNSFYFILLNRNKNNSKKDISIASFIAKKVFSEELEKKKEMDKCRRIALWRAERYLQKKLPSGGSFL